VRDGVCVIVAELVGVGVCVGGADAVEEGLGVALGVPDAVGVTVEVGDKVGVGLGSDVPVDVGVATRVGVADGVGLTVGVGDGITEGISVGVAVTEGLKVGVTLGDGVSAAVASKTTSAERSGADTTPSPFTSTSAVAQCSPSKMASTRACKSFAFSVPSQFTSPGTGVARAAGEAAQQMMGTITKLAPRQTSRLKRATAELHILWSGHAWIESGLQYGAACSSPNPHPPVTALASAC
jgi:hypothetical protein